MIVVSDGIINENLGGLQADFMDLYEGWKPPSPLSGKNKKRKLGLLTTPEVLLT